MPNTNRIGTELQIRRCLAHWLRLFLIPCSTCQKPFSCPDPALFQMDGWTHRSRLFLFFLSLNPSCFHLLLKPGKQPPAPTQLPPTWLNYACWVAERRIRFSLAVTYITSVAQGINVIHPAIPAKAPSTPCRDLPAWANRDRQTLVARNLSPNLLSPHIARQASNVSQSPRLPDAVRWQLPACVHTVKHKERGGCLCHVTPA